jgi:hypothetical protein
MDEDVRVVVAGSGDPELVNEIMRVIRRYCERNEVVPCPVELRDILLSVAALTHLEAAKVDCAAVDMSADSFAEAALGTFQDVSGMLAIPVSCPRAPSPTQH